MYKVNSIEAVHNALYAITVEFNFRNKIKSL